MLRNKHYVTHPQDLAASGVFLFTCFFFVFVFYKDDLFEKRDNIKDEKDGILIPVMELHLSLKGENCLQQQEF